MTESFKLVQQLVANFKANESAYLASNYSESQVRQDFIDKFFTALGWDVTHTKQLNPYEQEVKIENRVTMPGTQRRADYAFFVMPNYRDVKFFAEAKKPSRNLYNADDYYQAIRYAWNANTPIAVLTDFEEFHILDCRYKPDIKDALNRRLKQYHYSHYADEDKFKEIFFLFGRESVANGSIEKYVSDLPKPRGKAIQAGFFRGGYKSVDESFLEQLDEYRNTLAKAFKKENQELGGEELTEAVQRTLDRLVFIRFLEDKGIEEPQIIGLHENKSAWFSFLALCKRFETKYNGLIFKPHRILDGSNFNPPDDRDFADICGELADPSSPYDFDKIPISILGSIYERFLGKVVHATAKQVKVEEKPEVRKAGGVYYTPEYIVRYIAKETVGKLLNNKTPEDISKMAFADIACGSGSFLIEVYNQLIEYHEQWYNSNKESAKKGDVIERDGVLFVSLKKKKEILTNSVYGVDIDFQATEVTQLSLYLKLLENVTNSETYQLGMFKETILPNLNKNIICGNSLIGTEVGGLFAKEESNKLKPMNYEDVFPRIMKRGGFEAVVGNPPYGATFDENTKNYLLQSYSFQEYQVDSYLVFMEKAIKLLRNGGYFGYIIPNPWLTNVLQQKIRKYVSSELTINEIVHYTHKVFAKVIVDTEIVLLKKDKPNSNKVKISLVGEDGSIKCNEIDQIIFIELDGKPINIFLTDYERKLLSKIKTISSNLNQYFAVTQGCKPYQIGKGKPPQTKKIVEEHPFDSDKKKNKTFIPLLRGSNIGRYKIIWNDDYWISFGDWLAEPRYSAKYDAKEKIVIRQTGDSLIATLDEKQFIVRDNLYTIVPINTKYTLKYLLGLLNSKLLNYYYQTINPEKGEALAQVKATTIKQLPIRNINFNDSNDKSHYDNIVNLVDQMLEAKKKILMAKTDGEINRLELQCESLDRKIDFAVYGLYALTEEEIQIVEGA